MSVVAIDKATGSLVAGGKKLFPIGLSNPPPLGAKTPDGADALAEIAAGGISFVRTGVAAWTAAGLRRADRSRAERSSTPPQRTGSSAGCGSESCRTSRLQRPGTPRRPNEQLLTKVVNALKGHPALLA